MEGFKDRYERECRRVGETPAVSVQRLIEKGGSERKLTISRSIITTQQISCLARALANDAYFLELDFEDISLEDDGMIALAAALQRNTTVKKIRLGSNNIRQSGSLALGELLKTNSPVREVDLSWNTLGLLEEGVQYISSALASNNYLETLVLANCQLGHEAARAIATALMANSGLRVLDLRWNNLGAVGATALARSLEYNTTLQHLKLEGNHIPAETLQLIESKTANNRTAECARNAEVARAKLMQREIADITRRGQVQVNNLQRENEALAVETRTTRGLVDVLRESLGDTATKTETLETRLDIATAELSCRDREMKELMQSHTRVRDELAQCRATLSADLSAEKTARSRLESDLQKATEERHRERHAAQMDLQGKISQIELLTADLQRTRDELAAERRRGEEAAAIASEQLHSQRKLYEERIQAEREKAGLEVAAVQDQVRQGRAQLEQVRLDAQTAADNMRRAMDEAMTRANEATRAEHALRIEEAERRHVALTTDKNNADTIIASLREQISNLESRGIQQQLESQKAATLAAEDRRKAEREIGRLTSEVSSMERRIASLVDAEARSATELAKAVSKIEHTRSTHEEKRSDLDAKLAEKQREIEQLKFANKELERQLQALRKTQVKHAEGLAAAVQDYVANVARGTD
eukprot:m.205114 g.205114  ORF g.205114 m.205114 type:complete len:650 (+) comp15399_c2_seq1:760-2709(+)